MNNFEKWDKEFRNQNLFAFNNDRNALLWLKVRAISKKLPMSKFLEQNVIQLKSTKRPKQGIVLNIWKLTPTRLCKSSTLICAI